MLTNTHTYYSYKFGTWKPDDLLQRVREMGYNTVCITDINNTSAVVECIRLGMEIGVRVIPGIDVRNGVEQCYVALPLNNEGFQQLNAYLSHYLHSGDAIPPVLPATLSHHVAAIYPYHRAEEATLLGYLSDEKWKGYLGIRPYDIAQLRLSPLRHYIHRFVVLPTVSFQNQMNFNTHRLLRAIDQNLLLSKLPASQQGDQRHVLVPRDELVALYSDVPEAVRNTEALLEQCDVHFEFRTNHNKQVFTSSREEDVRLLKAEAEKGLAYRFRKADSRIVQRMEHELRIIQQMNFCSYFLINWDLVNYAQSKGYFYVGRGSGANSLVAYLLRITDVDPIELDLYFERFINPHRTSPPDFDIDFSWTDREDITRYLFDTHGRDKVALLAAYSTFKDRAISRELGKVLGVPAHEIDQLQKARKAHGIGKYGDLILKYAPYIENFPSHLSIHSSGILISEQPIHAYSPTFLPPKGYPTTQFDMIVAEDVGLYKFDILSQRGLGKIKDSIDIIRENAGDEIDIHDIDRFKRDERIKGLLREARAIGCFYVESPAMRLLLTKLRTEDYIGLVAASSVIRPGVARSGMMKEFIMRFRDKKRRETARAQCPELYDILAETYGVMVYQEDVIRVAHFFAGLDLADADILRRGMSWKFKQRNEFHRVRDRFFSNCREKGYSDQLTQRVWFEIESFANFAFAKGHSASYAVESYQALFLKAYYPIEYMVATVNNGGGFYRPELYLHEARMHGARIEAPCVNSSEYHTIVREKTVILGFHLVKDLDDKTVRQLLAVRHEAPFDSIADFVDRVPVGMEQLDLLIRVGAFRFTGKSKKELTWDARLLLGKTTRREIQPRLFRPQPKPYQFPQLYTAPLEEAFDQIELLGFPLCDPFDLCLTQTNDGVLAAELLRFLGKTVVAYGYLITARKTYTAKGEAMYFGNFVDRRGYFLDSVHFPPVAKAFPFTGPGVYRLVGKVTEDFGCVQIETTEMHRVPYIEDPRYAEEQTYKGTKDHSMINFVRN